MPLSEHLADPDRGPSPAALAHPLPFGRRLPRQWTLTGAERDQIIEALDAAWEAHDGVEAARTLSRALRALGEDCPAGCTNGVVEVASRFTADGVGYVPCEACNWEEP